MAHIKPSILQRLFLWLIVSLLAWPTFVLTGTVMSWLSGEGWQLDAWSQVPKRELLRQFLTGYQQSAIVTVPLGAVAIIDQLLLARFKTTKMFSGILLPLTGGILALTFYQWPYALTTLVIAGILLMMVYRLFNFIFYRAQ